MKQLSSAESLHALIAEHYEVLPSALLHHIDALVAGKDGALDRLAGYTFDRAEKVTAGMRSFVGGVTDSPARLSLILLARVLQKAGFSTDKIIQLPVLSPQPPSIVQMCALRVKDITLLRRYYRDDRIFKLLAMQPVTALRDTTDMMEDIYAARPELTYLPKKPKSLAQIHDCAVRTMPKLRCDDFDLKQREDVLLLDGVAFDESLTVRVPRTHYDLVELGEALSFCIGNGQYSRSVANQSSSVIALFERNKPRYGIQFSRYRIMEAQGFGNLPEHEPSASMLKQLMGILLKAPELPGDFLPITDSGWIHGYRYDNKNLYLLLKDRIYAYFDVPEQVYEDLLISERKGHYVNTVIKPGYACEFVGMSHAVTGA